MMHRLASVTVLLAGCLSLASADTIDFEGLPDSTLITTQYPGLVFSNAEILTAGISLNEFDFPPHSGVNVAGDDGGPIMIQFLTPVTEVGAYFTYVQPLSLIALDTSSHTLTAASMYSANYVSSGNPPNEFISFSDALGITNLTIKGNPMGGSFVMDDLTFTLLSQSTTVPEPSLFMGLGLIVGFLLAKKTDLERKNRTSTDAEASVEAARTTH